jgi:hypothetical protein
MEDEINISWINELETAPQPQERIAGANSVGNGRIFQNGMMENEIIRVTRQCQPTIDIHYIFINTESQIDHYFKETHECILRDNSKAQLFENPKTQLSKEELLKIIQTNKIQRNKRYRLSEILEYFIDLGEEEWDNLLETNSTVLDPQTILGYFNKKTFLKKINYVDDIFFESSISLFHKINSLYLIYIENDSVPTVTKPPIKISVSKSLGGVKQRTKKVRFNEENLERVNRKLTTTKKTH